MKMSYFADADTLYIGLRCSDMAETRDLNEDTLLELNGSGEIVALTLEHASNRTDISRVAISGMAA